MNHFILKSQRVVFENEMRAACIEVKNEKIVAIHEYDMTSDCDLKNLGNKVLLAGLVDTHVHINEPGRTDWEGFDTATQAAAAGGITTLVDMPLNCIPATTTAAAFQQKLTAVSDKLWVDCGFWGGVVPENLNELAALLEAGVLGVKSFLIDSGVDEFKEVSEEDIRQALPILAKYQVPYLIHAELNKDCHEEKHAHFNNNKDYQCYLNSRPKKWENDAVNLMLKLAIESQQKGFQNKIHIVHLSSAQAIPLIQKARSMGLNFSAETCPHYLTIESEQIENGKPLFKCCPPIRESENREQLWQGLEKGLIDFIVSDHSPCTPALKALETGNIEEAWGGISSLQFGLPLIWTEAKQRGFSLVDLSRLMSLKPAEFAGIDHVKGAIKIGNDADFVVFDDCYQGEIELEKIKYRHKITPYAGRAIIGKIEQTFLRGQVVYQSEQCKGSPIGKPILRHERHHQEVA